MLKARRSVQPPNPNTIKELGEMIKDDPKLKHLFKGIVRGDDGSIGIMLIHDEMLLPLAKCTQLFGDGTFDVRIYTFFLCAT